MKGIEIKARDFATKAHKGQFRKDNIIPFIEHPRAVVSILRSAGFNDENMLAGAWLHDVVEDCNIKIDEIEFLFGKEISKIVASLTKDCPVEEYNKRIENSSIEVKLIKIADIIHNCQSLFDGLPVRTILRKAADSYEIFLPLARKISPYLYVELKNAIESKMKK